MTRKRILVLSFFPAFDPPASGGELRLFNLYRALSSRFDVTMMTSTDFGARQEQVLHTPGFREWRFPKDEGWRKAYATLERSGLKGDLSGLAMALAVSDPACPLTVAARAAAGDADAIIHEFPYTEPVFADGTSAHKEIYNAHNFETSLVGAILEGPGLDDAVLKLLRLEGNLSARARLVLATSADDADKFRLIHGVPPERLAVCPNGFDEAEFAEAAALRSAPSAPRRPRLLFFGSTHKPNVEAAQFLLDLAPGLPTCDVVLAGTVCHALRGATVPDNVIVHGPFDRLGKRRLLGEADIFLNPVVTGSGTSLKAVEALGAGVPMLSTPEGVRGLELAPGHHAAIVDRRDFGEAIQTLIGAPERTRLLGEEGMRYARERYTWARIAERLGDALDGAPAGAPAPRRPLILAFNDYPVLDALWGGKARIRNLLGNLDADVVLLSFGASLDVVRLGPDLTGVLLPKTAEHRALEAVANAGQPLSVNDCVASLFVAANRVMRAFASALARRADAVVFEHCYMAPILDCVDAVRPGLPIVYGAHNVEGRHRVDMLASHSAGDAIGALVTEVEEHLVRRADLVVCCTEDDAAHFARAGAKTLLVANGCVVPESEQLDPSEVPGRPGSPRVGFMGSGHGPNIEAARFILRDLAPAFPDVVFEVVGAVGDAVRSEARSANVVLHGSVDEATKSHLLAGWSLALNPVASGGGSSLKLPDFMAHGLPTLSTPAGARGFDVAGLEAGLVVERPEFRAALRHLLDHPDRRTRMGGNALAYARARLSWAALALPYGRALRQLVEAAAPAADAVAGRSLLVVTYRYTEPSLGGAEEYLAEAVKRLRHRFDRIDLAAVDTGGLTNAYHFGCHVTEAGAGAAARLAAPFDRALFFTPEAVPRPELIEQCRRLERAWMGSEFDLRLPFARLLAQDNRLRLLSGFFGPECHGGVTRRWTSPGFAVLIPRHARTVRLAGFSPGSKTLDLTYLRVGADGRPEIVASRRHTVLDWFAASFALPEVGGGDALALHGQVGEHVADGDHRPLGLLLESVSALVSRSMGEPDGAGLTLLDEQRADFTEDVEQQIRTDCFEDWVAGLNAQGRRNPPAVEQDFATARGPHAPALAAWLAEHAGAYGTVLVQGIPFETIPGAVEVLSRAAPRPRIVTLPHFHGDDRFYYWRRYLAAFSAADATIVFSPSIARCLDLPGKLAVLPGGGVRGEENADAAALGAFRDRHGSELPFFLVLGRKTASKGYRRIMAAFAGLRARVPGVALVLIGPDEDGAAVEQDGVYCLGQQPRDVVRGALSRCLGLVTMSTSESFGIVLCEAWLFGKPVIANRACYAFRDLVRDGETGILVGRDDELEAAMAALLADREGAARLGGRGRDAVLARFTWDSVADGIDALCAPSPAGDGR